MVAPRQAESAPSSPADDEGVRVLRKAAAPGLRFETRALLGVGLVVAIVVGLLLWGPVASTPAAPAAVTPGSAATVASVHDAHSNREALSTPPSGIEFNALRDRPAPQGDPDDLASYFREGDDVPDASTLITALRQAGVRTGIGAFNPPGTSPPLEGLAVPADFALPPGYVRHHQVTDEGEIIEAILMFSPDLVLRDARGQPIAMPENRVVPPGLAPPGLPIRWVRPDKG